MSSVTDSGAYASGAPVTVTTTMRASRPCSYQPVGAGQYGCPTTLVVTDASGNQVWPWSGESEQCSVPAPTVLQAGSTETLRAAWNQQVRAPNGTGGEQAPPGSYQAVGTWSWSAGPGQTPYNVAVRSAPFVIS
ncbi:MAG TPA: hypothetical protein VMV14_09335 [Acidimicrobiales bacterium]|nr:hypothetical protein [Acidimicrobiales bacterium]